MTLRKLALTSTALSLLTAPVFADDNVAYIEQAANGDGNSGLIEQDGIGNEVGREPRPVRQVTEAGSLGNELVILQQGNGNKIGASGEQSLQQGRNGRANTANITQLGDGNIVGSFGQRARPGSGVGGNDILIVQGSATTGGNRIGGIAQRASSGNSNTLDVSMTGDSNTIAQIKQFAEVGTNDIAVDITGNGNGAGSFAPLGFADLSGASNSKLIQGKQSAPPVGLLDGGNSINLIIPGTDNKFGVTQLGTNNTVGTLTVSGNNNELGIFQEGDANMVELDVLDGDFNNIGISQNGTNFADVDVNGSSNEISISQANMNGNGADGFGIILSITGNFNGTGGFTGAADAVGLLNGTIVQNGMANLFSGEIVGDSNMFAAAQIGDDNAIMASVQGNMNQFAVEQIGNNNFADFSQVGNGNNLGIIQ
ncbi:MAG: hypothetical protein QNJ03_06220 [Dinoroseobacter sp.]|nr:hypothetical protein [Dinoroseobacter sp.]